MPRAGLNLTDKDALKKIEEKVEKKLKEVIDQLKAKHTKFEDTDFGPTEKDEFGAISFYGSGKPDPAGSKYPAPESLRWERPQYADNKFGDSKPSRKPTDGEETASEAEDEDDLEDEEEEDDEDDLGLSFTSNDVKVRPFSAPSTFRACCVRVPSPNPPFMLRQPCHALPVLSRSGASVAASSSMGPPLVM